MFLGLGFPADGVLGLWVFWSLGSLYEHRRINLGKKNLAFYASVNFFLFEWIYTIYTTKSTWGSKYFSTLKSK